MIPPKTIANTDIFDGGSYGEGASVNYFSGRCMECWSVLPHDDLRFRTYCEKCLSKLSKELKKEGSLC